MSKPCSVYARSLLQKANFVYQRILLKHFQPIQTYNNYNIYTIINILL